MDADLFRPARTSVFGQLSSVKVAGAFNSSHSMRHSHSRSFITCFVVAVLGLLLGREAHGQGTVTNIVQGEIAYPGERDTYSFALTSQKRFYFDALTNVSTLRWSIAGPPGVIVTNRAFTSTDAGNGDALLVLPAGTYSLTIEASSGTTNAYAFRLVDLAEATLLSPGSTVTNGAFLSKRTDFYQFSAAAGDQFTFTRLASSGTLYWRLVGPYDNFFFQQSFANVGTVTLPDAGTYVLYVESAVSNTGTNMYSFVVNAVGNAPRSFSGTPLLLGTNYYGDLFPAGTTNSFTFSLAQPTWLFFDGLTNRSGPFRQVLGPGGTVVPNGNYYNNWNIGQNIFQAPAGDYQLNISGGSYTNGYAFRLLDFAAAEPVVLNAVVNGTNRPASASSLYRVPLTAGQKVYFDAISQSGFTSQGVPYWKLVDPYGNLLIDTSFQNQGPFTITATGDYTLAVYGYDSETGLAGPFSFRVVPVADGSQSLALNTLVTGAISQPGQSQSYTFTLPTPTTISFDTISNLSAIRWSLRGPQGLLANNQSFNAAGWFIYPLPAGDYTITVNATTDTTNNYAFKVIDFAGATPISTDVAVNGTVVPAASSTAYRFNAAAGQTVFFDAASSSGFNNWGAQWTLISPSGSTLFDTSFSDRGPLTLSEAGTYTLLVGGYASYETTPSGSFSFSIAAVTNSTEALALNTVVNGAITRPGQARTYTFNIPVATRISFDGLSNLSNIRWTLRGPQGVVANNLGLNDANWFIYALSDGDYSLTVNATGDGTNGYAFRLIDFAAAPALTLDSTVNGSVVPATASTAYSLNATAGQTVYFNAFSQSGFNSYGAYWTLLTPSGTPVFDGGFSDRGPVTLAQTGTYTLLVGGYAAYETTPSGSFSFVVGGVTNSSQPMTLGDAVVGSIIQSGQSRSYTFNVPADTRVSFDVLTNVAGLSWSLTGSSGAVANNVAFSTEGWFIYPLAAGSYTVRVSGNGGDATGGYAFRVLDLSQGTTIPAVTTINGNTTPASGTTVYRFTANAGQRLFLDFLSQSGYIYYGNVYWRLLNPSGLDLFDSGASDRGPYTLTEGGTYTLLVGGGVNEEAVSGIFSFRYVIAPDTTQPLALDTLVTGTIGVPAQRQRYSFSLPAATKLAFDSWTNSTIQWSLVGPYGPVVASRGFNNSDAQSFGSGNPVMSVPAGSYELSISAPGDTVGDYSFVLMDLAAATPLALNSTQPVGLSPAWRSIAYRFDALPGDRIRFNGATLSGAPSAVWRLIDPKGEQLWYSGFNNSTRSNLLSRAGTYTLLVEGYLLDSVNGSLVITNTTFPNIPPPALAGTPVVFGQAYTNVLATSTTTNSFLISVPAPTSVMVDALNPLFLSYSVIGTNGPLEVAVNMNSTAWDNRPWIDLPAGDFMVHFWGNPQTMQVRFLDMFAAPVLPVNTGITNQIVPSSGSVVYRVTQAPGTILFYDGRLNSGFNGGTESRLYSLQKGLVWTMGAPQSDYGPFVLGTNETYFFAAEGAWNNTTASGSIGFSMQTPSVSTNALVLGSIVAGTLDGGGDVDSYTFTLGGSTRVFFDSLTNTYWTWTLSGSNTVHVNSRDARYADGPEVTDASLLLPAGSYVLRAQSETTLPTAYSFRLLDTAAATVTSVGATNSTNILFGTGTALYRFFANAGQRVFFDSLASSGFNQPPWGRLYSPSGQMLQDFNFSSSGDQPTLTLPTTGDYVFAVEGRVIYNTSGTGFVSFAYMPVTYVTNALALGTTVQATFGGGGDIDYYSFSLAATNRIFFDCLSNTVWRWSLTGPGGTYVDNQDAVYSDSFEISDSSYLLPPGNYLLAAMSQSTTPTAYSFRLLDSASAAQLTLGATNSTNIVGGVGTALYRFNASAGQRVYFDSLASTAFNQPPSGRLYSPTGQILQNFNFTASADQDTISLPLSGDYVFAVEGRALYNTSGTGYVSFVYAPVTYSTNSLALDTAITNTISQAGTRHFYTFSVPAPTRLFFDALTNSDALWSLSRGETTLVSQRSFANSDGSAVNDSSVVAPAGDYLLTVNFGLRESGTYGFRLLDAGTATPIALNTIVTNVSSPSLLTRLYRFNASAGDAVYFDGLGILSGGGGTPDFRLYSPTGSIVLNLTVASDQDTFVLPATGTYVVAHEGRFTSVSATQTTAFVFWSNPPKAPGSLFETNSSPDLTVASVSLTPPSGIQSGQGITVNWTLQNSGGAPTASSFTDRVIIRNTATSVVLVNSTLPYDQSQPENGPIPAGGQRNRQRNVVLPDGPAAAGPLEVTVTTDTLNNVLEQNPGGTGEANNASSLAFTTTIAPYPDLRVVSIAATPSGGWFPNGQVTFTWAVTNAGDRFTSNSWSERIVLRNLSTAQTLFTSNVVYDALLPENGPIGPADFRLRQLAVTLPNNAQVYGLFEISVETDSLGGVFEHNAQLSAETNNIAVTNLLSAPDLQIASLTVTPSPGPFSGALLNIQWRLTNSGSARAENGFYERVEVRNTTTGQVLANTTPYYSLGHITNGFGVNRSASVQLPDGIASVGTLEIIVSADAFTQVTEANLAGTGEANNSAVATLVTTLDEYPDLLVTGITVEPATIASGTNMTIRWMTTNSGTTATAGAFYDQVTVVNTNTGVTLANASVYYSSGPITNGTARSRSYNFTLPNNVNGAGGLLITVRADSFNNVFEFNPGGSGESNNVSTLSITSGLTPLPDLAVAYIEAPPTARPGVPFAITWALTNIGTAATVGSWNDAVYLSSDAIVGFDVFLGSRLVTNTIPAGGFLVVTQTVTLPPASESGPVYLVVQTDSGGGLNEILNNNNTLISPTPVIVPGALTLALSQSQIAENAINPNVGATVTRNGSRIADLLVTLASSDTTEATVPSTVLIPAGQASATFFVTGQADLEFDGPQVAQIVASSVGYDSATNSLTVIDSNQRRVTLTLSSSNAVEGGSVTATLTRDPVTATNLTVQLLSSDPNQLGVPAAIVIPAGVATTNFSVTPVDDSLIERTNSYTVTASATAHLPSVVSVSVEDNDIPNVTLTLASRNVSEGAGPNATSGTVTRSSPGPRNVVIALQSGNTSAIQVPTSVTIPSGALSASFPVSAVNNTLVDGPKNLTIIGYVTDSVNGALLRATTPDIITVTDDDGPTLRLTIAADLVPEGRPVATTATVTRNTPTTDPLLVTLSSDKPTEASVPASVTIPAGTNSATFNIASGLDGVTDGNQTVTITAASAGFTTGSDTLVVSDADLPDIVVTDLTAATNGYTAQNFVVSYTLGNSGLRGANTNVTQRIYVSTDPLVGSDTLGAQTSYNGPLNVGDSIIQQATVLMPGEPGNYWIIVEADVFGTVTEVLENNNTRISAIPVQVGPAYSATVSTDVAVSKANEIVPMTGHATSAANGQPATFVPVTIHVEVRGTRRTFTALTDGSGNFTFNFQPLPNEAGRYRILAAHPGVANPTTWQDQFSILGFTIDGVGLVSVVEGSSNSVNTLVRNLSDQPLTGLQVTVYTNHPSIQVAATLSTNTLAGESLISLKLDVTALNTSAIQSGVGVRLTTAEGVTNYLVFSVRQSLLLPALASVPGNLQTTMRLGRQTAVTFVVTNGGGRATGPLQILVPSLPWLALSSPQSLPPLEPGTNTTVTLLLTPPVELPLGDYTGTIAINATNASLAVPYRFRTVSEGIGDLKVTVEDEYTYFTEGSPRVTNALVRITDALSGVPVATNRTGLDGMVQFTNLTEAYYIVDVSADAHSSYRQSALVAAGQTTNVVAFLERQTVNYTFTVVPTTVEDRYQFQVESTFETQVPVPVVIMTPQSLDLGQFPGTDFQVEITLKNHGLIDANNVRLSIPLTDQLQIIPLITNIGTLGPNQSITIPVKVHRGPPVAQSGLRRPSDYLTGQCSVDVGALWSYLCGPNGVDKGIKSPWFDSTGCNLAELYNRIYELVPDPAIPPSSGGGGPAPTIPADAGSNFAPPPGFVAKCRPAPLNIIVPPSVGNRALFSRPPVGLMDGENGVCARVKLKLNQSAVLTRDAFNATLEIGNETAAPLSEVLVTLQIQGTDSTNATALFAIREPVLVGLTGVGGSGSLSAFTTGSASWIMVPTLDAAPTNGARVFLVGGTMSYVQSGTRVTVPLAPAPIQVFPQPELVVRYFHDRDVFADDPFTVEVEPSLPYSLGIQVENVGYGEARNLKITSGKPQIVENEKGLLIDFKILGAQLENQSITPALDVNFGSIGAGSNKIARWIFTSTLQGSFTNYSASFEHLDAMNGKRLSLVRSTEIHELSRIVNVDGAFGDSRPDFLVNDVPDPAFLPDTIYLSHGTVRPVLAVTNANVSNPISAGQLQAQITATMPTGWVYLRIGNPGGSNFVLKQVLRQNGTDLGAGTNAWTTDRFFRGGELRPIRTNLLHLVDYNSGGSYTLVFGVATNASDVTPPTSQMTTLPPVSPRDFTVTWDGSDDITGVAYYDLYVSTNSGPYGLFASRLTSPGTVFHGQPGATYAFFTVATDSAGNSEPPAVTPKALTTVTTAVNQPPVISGFNSLTINEGEIFAATPTASDPDGASQVLTFSLANGPAGALINSSVGSVFWPTTEALGGQTYPFSVVVTDNGQPSLSATQTFSITVVELNSPPAITSSSVLNVNEDSTLSASLTATDTDQPAQALTWQLLSGAPAGMTFSAAGLMQWTPTELDGPTNRIVTLRVTDSGSPALSVTQVLNVVVAEVNRSPQIAPVAAQFASVGIPLTFTNSATDPDLPANRLTFSLGAGAPRGARINPTNGAFAWTPTPEYASTTNTITVRVTDDGLPALLASTSFTVGVGDFLGFEVGSAIVLTNEAASLPLRVTGTAQTRDLTVVIQAGAPILRNVGLIDGGSAMFQSGWIDELGSNTYKLYFHAPEGVTGSTNVAARLTFTTTNGGPSAIVPIKVLSVSGERLNGQPIGETGGTDGRLVFINREPIMELYRQPQDGITFYGRPGIGYEVQFTSNLFGGDWTRVSRFPLTNRFLQAPVVLTNGGSGFFRTLELGQPRPLIDVLSHSPAALRFMLYGEPGASYDIETKTDVGNPWTFRQNVTLSVGYREVSLAPPANGLILIRAVKK